jgi:hypothetical protein
MGALAADDWASGGRWTISGTRRGEFSMTLFTLALLLLTPTAAATTVNAGPARQSADDKIVCKLTTEAGTKIPQRVCRTQGDWEKISKDAQDDIKSSRNQRSCGSALAC